MSVQYHEAVGRRKEASARVRLFAGSGKILVNNRPAEEYFPREGDMVQLLEPLRVTETEGKYDITVLVKGGGVSGQLDAVRHGIARALLKIDPEMRLPLRKAGLLTRDPR
ncbi:MAG: 30S ribosomal protein S9, partial [Anaerolineae bacterium]